MVTTYYDLVIDHIDRVYTVTIDMSGVVLILLYCYGFSYFPCQFGTGLIEFIVILVSGTILVYVYRLCSQCDTVVQ